MLSSSHSSDSDEWAYIDNSSDHQSDHLSDVSVDCDVIETNSPSSDPDDSTRVVHIPPLKLPPGPSMSVPWSSLPSGLTDDWIKQATETVDFDQYLPDIQQTLSHFNRWDSLTGIQSVLKDTSEMPWLPYTYDSLPVRERYGGHVLIISNINFMVLHTFLLHTLRSFIKHEIFPDGRVLETTPSCITIYNGLPVYSLRFFKDTTRSFGKPLIIVQFEEETQWHPPNSLQRSRQDIENHLLTQFNKFSASTLTEDDHIHLLWKTIVQTNHV